MIKLTKIGQRMFFSLSILILLSVSVFHIKHDIITKDHYTKNKTRSQILSDKYSSAAYIVLHTSSVLILPYYWYTQNVYILADYIFSYGFSHGGAKILKKIIQSPRPDSGELDSFPSGHTLSIFFIVFFILKHFGKKWSIPLGTIGIVVAWARIFSMRHNICDVIFSIALSFVVVMYTLKIFLFIYNLLIRRLKFLKRFERIFIIRV